MAPEEYAMLRQEILNLVSESDGYKKLLLTATLSMLALSFVNENPLILMLPAIITLPFYCINVSKHKGIIKIGTYIYLFAGKGFEWERRLYQYGELDKNNITPKKLSIVFYISNILSCFALFMFKYFSAYVVVEDHTIRFVSPVYLLIACVILLFCVYYIFSIRYDHQTEKDRNLALWNEIKSKEEFKRLR